MLPVVALVGRPNVGKSTLFNALVRSRDALVADMPGLTRDRHYGICQRGDVPFLAVDTGGLTGGADDLDVATAQQAALAIEEAVVVVLLVDAREGLLPQDEVILRSLRKSGKPLILAVNKVDGLNEVAAVAEFAGLGLGHTIGIAASHQRGVDDLLDAVAPYVPATEQQVDDDGGIRVAVVGRPNAGKSTLVNRLLGEERQIVSDQAGTTRDSIHIPLERDGHRYTLIDTAGIRRRSRVHEAVEKFSVIKAMQAIDAAEVVVLMVDARENLAEQDLTLIGHVLEAGRALVIAVNKWDGLDSYDRDRCRAALDRRLDFVGWAEQVTISAKHGSGLRELLRAVHRAHRSATRELTTSDLTRTLEQAYNANQPPLVRGHAPKLKFAHPAGTRPPAIAIHGSRTRHIAPNYRRYLENYFRKHYKLVGTPIRIEFREDDNPFAGRRNKLTESQLKKRQRMLRHVKR